MHFGAPGLDGVVLSEGTHGFRDGLDCARGQDELAARREMQLDQSQRGLLHEQIALMVVSRGVDGRDDCLGRHPCAVEWRDSTAPAKEERTQDGLRNHGVAWERVECADARFRTTCLVRGDVVLQRVDPHQRAEIL